MLDDDNGKPPVPGGWRARIVEPHPPAPVPAPPRKRTSPQPVTLNAPVGAPRPPAATDHTGTKDTATASDRSVVKSTGSMAIATLVSRITGFLRTVVLGATLGPAVGSAFNTANTLPNLITEIVLGAVLTSLVVPVLVRAEKEDPDHGAAFIRRLMTVALAILVVVTTLAVIGAGWLTAVTLGEDGKVNLVQATGFAYLLLPQIIFYGVFSLFMAVLNTKGVFKPGAWAPVANNIVVLAVFAAYWLVPGALRPEDQAGVTNPHVLLLGLGTTAGVVVQALIMVPYLKKAGIDLRPLWGIDERLKQFGGMALAIVVYVAISQVGYIITTRIAAGADARAPLIYQQAWLLLQVPYGIIGVTMLTAIMPRLSRNAAAGDDRAVVGDLTLATKLTIVALIPIIVFMTAFGTDIANALFAYRLFTAQDADLLGWTLSFSAFTLIPYALVLLHLRVFYAREEAWTPTFIIGGITGTKVVLSLLAPVLASSPSRVVILLGAANGFGFVAGAVIGIFLLRRKLGSLNAGPLLVTSAWTGAAAFIAAVAVKTLAWAWQWITASPEEVSSLSHLAHTAVAGVVFVIITGVILARSGLPEVKALAAVAARLPVIGPRLKQPDNTADTPMDRASEAEVSQLLSLEPFNASPVPPPMSAGVVHGPRLVPGAPVADGRFRLLAEHGSVTGARFWHALEKSTGREVALTFVDTTGPSPTAPLPPSRAAAAAGKVEKRTMALAGLNESGIATGIEVVAYRAGCLVIADWTHGTSLAAIADDGTDPRAACWALSHLADAAAAAHAAGQPLGLEHCSRIRITTDGRAVLAFPAVLPDNTETRDIRSIGAALNMLCAKADNVPAPVTDLIAQAVAAGGADTDNESGQATRPPVMSAALLAAELEDKSFAGDRKPDDSSRKKIHITASPTPSPTDTNVGFGSAGYSSKATAVIVALSIALVLFAAGLMVYVIGLFGGNEPDAPVKQNPIANVTGNVGTDDTDTATAPPAAPEPAEVAVSGAREWQPAPVPPGFEDNPQLAPLASDGDPATFWTTDTYRNQFAPPPEGTKVGIGVLVDLASPTTLTAVTVTSDTPGTGVQIFGVPPTVPRGGFTSLEQARPIGGGDLVDGPTVIGLDDPGIYDRVLVWVNKLPMPSPAHIAEIGATGIPAAGAAQQPAPAPAAPAPPVDDNPPVDANQANRDNR